MANFKLATQLRELQFGIEKDLGINRLNSIQKNIIYTATILSRVDGTFETADMRQHNLLQGVSQSGFFRSLKSLVDIGYLKHFKDRKRSIYELSEKFK